jgi:hypothetical protein
LVPLHALYALYSSLALAAKKVAAKKPVLKKAAAKKPVAAKKVAKKVVKKVVRGKMAPVAGFEEDIGATLPLGFFDPLGLVADGDQATFDRLRVTELKHGRISMILHIGMSGDCRLLVCSC